MWEFTETSQIEKHVSCMEGNLMPGDSSYLAACLEHRKAEDFECQDIQYKRAGYKLELLSSWVREVASNLSRTLSS